MLHIILMCISHFVFFLLMTLFAVYFIFILDYGNDFRLKIQVIFLLEFKMACKTVQMTHNINSAFGPGCTNKHTVQWWFKKFLRRR